jgi:sporulation protein YlmC with PRC-barrel domain
MTKEVRLERLLGREVLSTNNQRVGRLEEFRAETRGKTCTIGHILIGVAGFGERVGVGMKRLVGSRVGGYIARWDQMDFSDPDRPRLTCPVEQLQRV